MATKPIVATLYFILVSCCLGCGLPPGASYERIPVAETKSIIYVYNDCLAWQESGFATVVSCGDDTVDLELHSYHRFTVEPGPVECGGVVVVGDLFSSAELPLGPVRIDAKAGRDNYLRQELRSSFFSRPSSWRASLTLVDRDSAEPEISRCRRDAPYVPDASD
jgi:hypothetical protein